MIDLDTLTSEAAAPKVRLFGREITVLPLTGRAAHRLATVREADAADVFGALLEVIRSSCPALSTEDLDRLTVEQITALVQIARGQITEVESMLQDRIAEQTAGKN